MSRFVVTGGAGFLGSHLCERLLARGDSVVCVDNFSSGRQDNIESFADDDGFDLVTADVSVDVPVEGPIDGVFHLASPASPPDYMERPLETLIVGSEGTRHALELARENDARLLLTSTSEVYGDPEVHPQPETYWGNVNSIGLRSVYDEAKRFAEALTMAYKRTYDADVAIARIFNTYGPRMRLDDGRVVSNFIGQALQGHDLTVYGDGEQTRCFLYVDDQIDGLLALYESGLLGPVNIGSPEEITMREFADLVLKLTGSSSGIATEELPADDPKRRRPDITRAREQLGWSPTIPLEVGLAKTVDYFREALT